MCPWLVGHNSITDAKLKGMCTDSWLFRDFRNSGVTKSGVIKRWKKIFGNDVSGHSPRRNGAMFYVRRGLPIQELAFLGRWKSSVVLQYDEEALQEKAVCILNQLSPPTAPSPMTPASHLWKQHLNARKRRRVQTNANNIKISQKPSTPQTTFGC